jgi:serine/threonine-protein kinase HipA
VTDRRLLVYVDLDGKLHLAGRLWARVSRGRESASFEYDETWLKNPLHFALEPALALGPGPFHTAQGRALFGTLGDSAPDRWGRNLIARAERKRSRAAGMAPRTLLEIDYLLGVSDETRLGALRFAELEGGPFLREKVGQGIPPLVDLPALVQASANVEADEDSESDLRLLLAPGSSLGGARPKASVRGATGDLLIAKFPSRNDDYDVVRWEAVALALAQRAGIGVPSHRLTRVANRHVLILDRFDRDRQRRMPVLSAMTLLGAEDRDTRSYVEIADALRQYGARVATDLPQLWRRIVFTVLISNTDDHLRNHALTYEGTPGWRLSPAYDLNPVPVDLKPRVLSTTISLDGDPSASLALALEVANDFAVGPTEARTTVREVADVVADWRSEASKLGLTRGELDRMSSAFEHEELASARR